MKQIKIGVQSFLFLLLFAGLCQADDLNIGGAEPQGSPNCLEKNQKEMNHQNDQATTMIKVALDAMIEAYESKNASVFMSYVSEDFAGGDNALEYAIQKDFSAFYNVDLSYNMGTLTLDKNGIIFVSLNYTRFLVSSRNGMSYTDKGTTEFAFRLAGNNPVLYSMKNPLIFGLSDAGEVATGTVIPADNGAIIVVDGRGNVTTKPFHDAMRLINTDQDIE